MFVHINSNDQPFCMLVALLQNSNQLDWFVFFMNKVILSLDFQMNIIKW